MLTKPAARVRTLPGHPLYATATTVSGAIAGLLGSVYQDDVAAAFPMTWSGPWPMLSRHALAFWTALIVFGALFHFRQRFDDHARARLTETSHRIAMLVQTLPPRAFRAQYAQAAAQARIAEAVALPRHLHPETTEEELAALARELLCQIAELARVYDDQPLAGTAPAVYAANVMMFVPASPGEPVFPPAVAGALRFLPREVDLRKLSGVLWLRNDLFATNRGSDLTSFPAVALPVAKAPQRHGRWTVLPGAPRAFVTGTVDGYMDTHTLAEFCRREGDFSPSVIRELDDYFRSGPGRMVRSFISRPLLHGTRALGVLNLHSNRRDILGPAEDRRETFQALMTPLLLDLAEVVAFYTSRTTGGSGETSGGASDVSPEKNTGEPMRIGSPV